MKRALAVAATILLSACAETTINGPSRLTGQELDAAVALYGGWVEQVELQGRPLYIWRRSLVRDGQAQFCELRVELGFRQTISRAYLQGFPEACRLFAVRYEPVRK